MCPIAVSRINGSAYILLGVNKCRARNEASRLAICPKIVLTVGLDKLNNFIDRRLLPSSKSTESRQAKLTGLDHELSCLKADEHRVDNWYPHEVSLASQGERTTLERASHEDRL